MIRFHASHALLASHHGQMLPISRVHDLPAFVTETLRKFVRKPEMDVLSDDDALLNFARAA